MAKIKVAELFAGVGGFRLGLDGYASKEHPEFNLPAAGNFETIWANQWEPPGTKGRQFAWRCYEERFGKGSCVNEDINKVLNDYEALMADNTISDKTADSRWIPNVDMIVGGFPCQDYSVAKPLKYAGGIEGKKGVLWWDIYRMIQLKQPRYLLLENVDRLLKSPVKQRGRDFAIILSCFAREGYSVQWRVINAADYGMPQKRKRVYIYAEQTKRTWNLQNQILKSGVIAKAFPVENNAETMNELDICLDPYEVSENFGKGLKVSPFEIAGAMQNGHVLTIKATPKYKGSFMILSDIVVPDKEVPNSFFIKQEELPKWEYQRSAKREPRVTNEGFEYIYTEGAMAWPDPIDKPARTILTGEGGTGASRMKHAIMGDSGRIRRLIPDELDQIQMFPKGWTNTGMSDGNRAFCMGNALVVGIPHKLGVEIAKSAGKK